MSVYPLVSSAIKLVADDAKIPFPRHRLFWHDNSAGYRWLNYGLLVRVDPSNPKEDLPARGLVAVKI